MIRADISPYPSPWIQGMAPLTFYVRLKSSVTGQAIDITGATVTGKLGSVAMAGTFTPIEAATGTFSYTPNAAEATGLAAGRYALQFKATGGPTGIIFTELYPIDVQVPQ